MICSCPSRLRRAMSLSTPSLAAAPKQTRGQCPGLSSGRAAAVCWPQFSLHPLADSGEERKRREPSVSKVEQQRQQILEEMKKRTQLLTDNSWIRQRSSSVYKEPIYVPLKRPAWLFWFYAPPPPSHPITFSFSLAGLSPWTTWMPFTTRPLCTTTPAHTPLPPGTTAPAGTLPVTAPALLYLGQMIPLTPSDMRPGERS